MDFSSINSVNIEKDNLAEANPELCNRALRYLNEWHDTMMANSASGVDPLWTVMQEGGPFHARGNLKDFVKRLEASGRGHAVPELKRRHPQEFE
jgi:choline-sulfatase